MNTLNDPLRNGDIFKMKAGALRSPPKIVQFEVPKGSASKTPVKSSALLTVNSEVRTAFDHIYRQTPTPKVLLTRSVQERTSTIHSPYWASNSTNVPPTPPISSIQTPIISSSDVYIPTNTVPKAASSPGPPAVFDEPPVIIQKPRLQTDVMSAPPVLSESEAESDHAEPELIIKPVKRADTSSLKSPNLMKKARTEQPVAVKEAAPKVAPARDASSSSSSSRTAATTNKSRAVSRSRTGGADSLLLLLGGAPKTSTMASSSSSSSSSASAASSSSSSSNRTSSSSGTAVQRSSSTGRTVANSGSSRPQAEIRSQPTQSEQRSGTEKAARPSHIKPHESTDTVPAPIKQRIVDSHTVESERASAGHAASKGDAVTAVQANRASLKSAAARNTSSAESDSDLPLETITNSVIQAAASKKQSTGRGGVKRGRAPGDDLERSESEVSPPAVKAKTLGRPRKAAINHNKSIHKESSEEEEAEVEGEEPNEADEEEITVTRSGRKSIPKKTIPLAEDEMQSEKQQLKANRRASSAAPARRASVSTGSRSRKSLGSATDADTIVTTQAEKGTRATKNVKSAVWAAPEVMALYSVQGRVDISAPDFWEQVSEGLAEVNVDRSAQECQQQWFKAVEIAAERKRAKEEQMKNKVAELKKNEQNEEAPAKVKRLGKVTLKKMAQESSKATRDDDIFDSAAMRPYWAEEETAVNIDQNLLEDLQLFVDNDGEGALGSAANKRKSAPIEDAEEESAIEFGGGSHVHKLHYRPPSKLYASARATISDTTSKAAPSKLVNAKTGKVNSNLITKQVSAAVQGARTAVRGGAGRDQSDSSEDDSDDLDSEDEEDS